MKKRRVEGRIIGIIVQTALAVTECKKMDHYTDHASPRDKVRSDIRQVLYQNTRASITNSTRHARLTIVDDSVTRDSEWRVLKALEAMGDVALRKYAHMLYVRPDVKPTRNYQCT